MAKCFECDSEATHYHHVVPRSLGGIRTVPLCSACHPKAHGKRGHWKTSELTKAALARKRARGESTGGDVPYGYHRLMEGRLTPSPTEFKTIRLMHSLRQQGHTLRGIAAILKSLGIKTKKGKRNWQAQVIRGILNRTATFAIEQQ